jgi:hypothetical protein
LFSSLFLHKINEYEPFNEKAPLKYEQVHWFRLK